MRDRLPNRPMRNESAIVNLDKYEGSGTHWVCYRKRGNLVEYFDSFGVGPPAELIKYFGDNCTIYYNSEQVQKVNQIICGHLCLEWLDGFHAAEIK